MLNVSLVVLCVGMFGMTKNCIKLIRENTAPIYELIIVADACPPKMLDWLKSLERQKRAKIIINEKPVGAPTALNMGIKAAKQKYISFVENDIRVTKGWLSELMNVLKQHPEYGWVASRVMRGNFAMNFGSSGCSLFLKEAIDKVGLFDERFSQGIGWDDNDYELRFWLAGYNPHGVLKSTVYHPPGPTTVKAIHKNKIQEKYELNLGLFIQKWGPIVMRVDWVNIPCVE